MWACVSMGGNVGHEAEIVERFRGAVRLIPGPVQASRVHRTAPVGPVRDQAPFLNCALRIETAEAPHALLQILQAIESSFGRDRDREVRSGPRTLDLDLLLVGDIVMATDTLSLPHPRMTQRAFVLRPLSELVGAEFVLPGGTSIAACLAQPDVASQVTEVVTREALRL